MSQRITVSFRRSPPAKADTVLIFATSGEGEKDAPKLLPSALALDEELDGQIMAALRVRKTFKGRHGDAVAVILPNGAKYRQVLVLGIGSAPKFDALTAENAGGKALGLLKSISSVTACVLFDGDEAFPEKTAVLAAAFGYGLRLKDYAFDKYRQKKDAAKKESAAKDETRPETACLVVADTAKAASAFADLDKIADGVVFARDLVSEPPNALYPESYADILVKTLKPLGVEVEVLDEKKMQKLGFGAHLAVGMGSARPPRVVIMRWNGGSKKAKGKTGPVALVGKGVTFDTGGISIKPAAGMEEMKMDMGGSAAVAGAIHALAAMKAKVDVVGIVGLAENMPSDRSYRPGDIVTSLSGKTIEVLNTDAEGRLVLADALTYVQRTYKPSAIVDLATLTGAIMVALGHEYAGVFANDDALWARLENASGKTGEKVWRMPLDEAYRDEMKNTVSDLKNLGNLGRYGGACSAAGFLEHFVEAGTPWAHIDIAGTAWIKSDRATVPKGATGYGVRLLCRLLSDHYAA